MTFILGLIDKKKIESICGTWKGKNDKIFEQPKNKKQKTKKEWKLKLNIEISNHLYINFILKIYKKNQEEKGI